MRICTWLSGGTAGSLRPPQGHAAGASPNIGLEHSTVLSDTFIIIEHRRRLLLLVIVLVLVAAICSWIE